MSDHTLSLKLLRRSEQICREAVKSVESRGGNRLSLSHIHVELASTYGQMATHVDISEERLEYSKMAHKECYISIRPSKPISLDVIFWTVRDLLESKEYLEEQRLQLVIDVLHAFNLADAEGYTGASLERLNVRKEAIYAEDWRFGVI